ncbi:MAG: methyltransferase [Rubrivivax sp.]
MKAAASLQRHALQARAFAASLQRHALQARAFAAASALFTRLRSVLDAALPPAVRAVQIGSAFWQSRALDVAVRLDLATTLGDDRLAPEDLAVRTGTDPQACRRLLRYLSSLGVFAFGADGRVCNNAVSNTLRRDRPGSVRHLVLMHNAPEMTRAWIDGLEAAVRGGGVPFERVHGVPLYACMDERPDFDALFARAMDEVGALTGDAFVSSLAWDRFEHLVDLGGGKGAKTAAILRAHAQLRATVFDRPAVIALARSWWQDEPGRRALAGRVTFECGDLMHDPLPAAPGPRTVYLLSAVLHGLDDDAAGALLARVRSAAGDSGARVVVMEAVMGTDPAVAALDIQMFIGTQGRERTLGEWETLARAAGLRVDEVVRMPSLGALIVLARA